LNVKYDKKSNGIAFIHKDFIQKYIKTASPVIANEFMWGLGVTMYSVVYGRMGVEAAAAITMTSSVEALVMVFYLGICNAAAVILGNELGADELEHAHQHAQNYMILQFILSIGGALLTFIFRDAIVSIFPTSESALVESYIRLSINVLVFYMPVKALNTLLIVAILRSGGDTKAALFLDVSGVWAIGIPMAVLGGLVLHLPIYIVYAMVMIEEVYKVILGYIRYRQNKWLKNIVN
jgi:Na+-driven multidrug efflux pump